MTIPRFDLREPRSLDEALAILAEGGPAVRPLAGGTDLVPAMKKGLAAPEIVLSLRHLAGLDAIELKGDQIVIGPLVTMSALARSDLVAKHIPVLADGARQMAAPLIRNRATVGGNLCNARPCADTAPPLLALDATVTLASAKGRRVLSADGLIVGPGLTVMEQGELLTAISVPLPEKGSGGAYLKMMRRQTLDITIAGVASQITIEQPGPMIRSARIFASSVAPMPLRLVETENCVIGSPLIEETLTAAAEAARREITPIDDLRGEAWYRRHVTGIYTKRTLVSAARRAGGGES